MTSSPVANAANIEQPKANPNTGNGRKLMMPWHIGQFDISSNAFRVIVFIISAYGDDGLIKFKRATLAACCHISTQVLDRVLIELKGSGLIRYRSTGRCLQFWLTDLCWPGANKPRPVESENHYQQRNRVITGNETPNIGMKRNIRNEKETAPHHEPPPKPKPKPAEKPTADIQAAPVFLFQSKTIKKLGDFADSIAKSCAHIVKMPGKKDFNPAIFIYRSLKDCIHPKVIDESLSFVTTFASLDDVDPYAVVRNRSRTKTHKYNAKDAENENDMRKKEAIRHDKIVVMTKSI